MTRTAALVLAAWTAAGAANAQVIRVEWDNANRGGDSVREILGGQAVPREPQGREVRDRGGERDRGPRREPRGGRREDRMRGAPDRWDGGGVRRLAERIDIQADALYRDYDQNSRTGNFFGKISRAAGLETLRTLTGAAHRFRREVDSRWSDPVETRENYLDLVRAMDQADQDFFLAYKSDTVREQYRRVSDSVEELIRYYRWSGDGRRDDRRGGYGRARCEGVNFWGKYYEGGGCDIHGCWTYGGGCNSWGCWSEGGSCTIHGCIRQVPSQPCVE